MPPPRRFCPPYGVKLLLKTPFYSSSSFRQRVNHSHRINRFPLQFVVCLSALLKVYKLKHNLNCFFGGIQLKLNGEIMTGSSNCIIFTNTKYILPASIDTSKCGACKIKHGVSLDKIKHQNFKKENECVLSKIFVYMIH